MAVDTKLARQSPFHDGELAVQRQAGVSGEASKVGQIIDPEIPLRAAEFLLEQPFAIAASVADNGRVWASLLSGAPGFLLPQDPRTLDILNAPLPGDDVADTFRRGGPLGLLAIDPSRRWRMRLNGRATPLPTGGVRVHTEQVYGNCQKYIQRRQPLEQEMSPAVTGEPIRTAALSDIAQQTLATADTFFVASYHPEGGADASHRGGLPGFVRVLDERRLAFPDYAGNAMFNTLGNLSADPRIGLLFVDFARGGILQLAGAARIVWEPAALGIAEAERAVEVTVSAVVAWPDGTAPRWRLLEYSRFNPPVTRVTGDG